MWLGIFAVIIAVSYALIKFLTNVHMRRLVDKRGQLNLEVQKVRGRVSSLDGKIQVARSHLGAIEQKLDVARRFKKEIHDRLRVELPDERLIELRSCISRNPVPEPGGVRIFNELEIANKISTTLGAMSVAVFHAHIPAAGDESEEDGFVKTLEKAGVKSTRHTTVKSGSSDEIEAIVTTFDSPVDALELTQAFIQKASAQDVAELRGIVLAGVNENRVQADVIDRIFAKALERAMQSLATAPPGCLLLNRAAFDILTAHGVTGLELPLDRTTQLYAFRWQTSPGPAASRTSGEREKGAPVKDEESGVTAPEETNAEAESATDEVDPKTLESAS